MWYPLTFKPIFKERVWGGRRLRELYGKDLPDGAPIGESWEITDRPEGVSVVANGSLAGRDLRWLMEHHRDELLGSARDLGGRFPLLIKLLDACDRLSLQVHPPAGRAAELGGEPKTEMWYVAAAEPGADIFAGLKRGVTREEFERRTRDGTVAGCFHRHEVRPGDVMFLPSGRVHALGAGSVIFEIQQNSDTTYRVFDWNRVGLDGRPRELHLEPAMASIDFDDFEPPLVTGALAAGKPRRQSLVNDPLFTVEHWQLDAGEVGRPADGACQIIAVTKGEVTAGNRDGTVKLRAGGFALLPAGLRERTVRAEGGAELLVTTPG